MFHKYSKQFVSEILITLVFVSILSLFTIGIAQIIRSSDYFFVPNIYTFGVKISNAILLPVLLIVTFSLFYFRLTRDHLIPTMILLTGGWSNLIEKMVFGAVTDYIPFVSGYINIADIMIWSGLIWLNFSLWFLPDSWKKTNSKRSIDQKVDKIKQQSK